MVNPESAVLEPNTVPMGGGHPEKILWEKEAKEKAATAKMVLEQRVKSLRIQGENRSPGLIIRAVTWAGWAAASALLVTSLLLGWLLFRGKTIDLAPKGENQKQNLSNTFTPNSKGSKVALPQGTGQPPITAETNVIDPETPALVSSGYLLPIHQIQVSPKVSGMIVKLNFEEGMAVPKGFVLAELETVEYQADLQKTSALLNEAKHKLTELTTGARPEEIRQAKLELDEVIKQREQLKLDYDRTKRLLGVSALSARELEQAQFSFEAIDRRTERLRTAYALIVKGNRMERIQVAQAQVDSIEADLVKAKWRLDNCLVKAPASGIILNKKAEEGNMVNPAAFNVSANLCEMANLTQLEVDLAIQERDFAKIKPRMECHVMPEAYRNSKEFLAKYPKGYTAFLSRAMPQADRAKGAIPVRVKVDIPENEQGVYLKPDMRVEVTFYEKTRIEPKK